MEERNGCRICLVETKELQTIFTSLQLEDCKSTIPLSEMICSFTETQITLGDGLPEQICKSCAKTTVEMYVFKLRIEESDRILKNKLFDSKINNHSSDEEVDATVDFHVENSEIENTFPNFDYQHFLTEGNEEMYEQTDDEVAKALNVKDIICRICNKQFSREDSLFKHQIGHIVKMRELERNTESIMRDFDDSQSGELSEPVVLLRTLTLDPDNLNFESKVQCFTCGLCNCVFLNENMFKKHFNEHAMKAKSGTEDGAFLCKLCNYETNDTLELKIHTRKNHNGKISEKKCYPCPHCLMEYSKESSLQNHLKFHKTTEKVTAKKNEVKGQYTCNHCDKVFETKFQLKRHLRRSAGGPTVVSVKQSHVCQICLKAFNQLSNLKDHIRIHNGEKPFLCPTCGKGFNQQGNLKQHQVRHSGVKAHKCSICDSGFASRGELKAHLLKHTGARPFVCGSCGNGFTTSSSLTKHKRIHSGEKPYECEFCKLKFSQSGILTRHRRIHTGEKPYICNICQKAFTQSNDLTSHQRIHTGEKPFKCNECGQPFRQSSALKVHKKLHSDPNSKQIGMKEKAVYLLNS